MQTKNHAAARALCPARRPASPDFFSHAFKRDPHATYAELREMEPIHSTISRDGRVMHLVTRRDEVLRVLKDPRFVKNMLSVLTDAQRSVLPPLPPAMRYLYGHMLASDPPHHTRLRSLVRTALSPRLVEGLRPRARQIANQLLDRVCEEGRMDLIDDFAFPFPITVIGELLGLPEHDHALLRDWSNVLITHVGTLDKEALAAVVPVLEEMASYLRQLFVVRRDQPRGDLVSELLQVEQAGDKLSEDELISMVLLLVLAGHETTVNVIGNGVLTLLRHPHQLARLRAQPTLLSGAIEEILRFEGPVDTSTPRYVAEDLELGGVAMKKGELVLVVLSSANRGRALLEDGDTFDLTRDPSPHLAFGHGIHFCLGAALARLEAEVAFETLLRRLSSFKLASPESALEWRLGILVRGLKKLPLEFTAAPR